MSFFAVGQPPWVGPNTAFVLTLFGVLGIYCEFIWPGHIYPLLLGGASAIAGAYYLWRLTPSPLSLALIGAATFLFIAESIWRTYFVAGVLGTAVLATGFCNMFRNPPWIVPGLAIPLCCVFGAVTCFLCSTARHSREMKRSDLNPQ